MKNSMRRPVRMLVAVAGLFLVGLVYAGTAGAAEVVIIGNPSLPGPNLEAKDLVRIYLGKQTRWDDNKAIVPVMLKASPVHEDFVETYLGRSPHRFVTYWRQMVFTGKGTPPRSFASEEELIAYVAATPGAVGYASATTDVRDVKVLPVTED